LSSPISTGSNRSTVAGYGWKLDRSTHIRTIDGPGSTRYAVSIAGRTGAGAAT
jgi:hypothetical protein